MKDIIYDISDIVISLVIITVIFFVISWKLNESMPISYQVDNTDTSPIASNDTVETAPDTETSVDDIPFAEERPTEGDPVVAEPEVIEPEVTDPVPEVITPTPSTPSGQEVEIVIPSGSTGFAIAKILKDQGFISDINGFISKVEEMGLGAKLRSGTFKLKTDMNQEQVIKILAGVRD